MKKIFIIFISIFTIISWNCESEKPAKQQRIVIGVSSDAETLNPLFVMSLIEGQINELLFLSLVRHDWDDSLSDITSSPLLAEKWEWNSDSSSVTFYLRNDAYWSDGVKLTSEDIFYTFDLYSDPDVGSKFFGSFNNLILEENEHINLNRTFEILSPQKIRFNFKPGIQSSLFDIDMPILPKHVFSKIPRKELRTASIEKNLVTSGPYTLSNWKKNEAIFLKAVKNSFLYDENMVKELIFKIIPDENSKTIQLKKGEIDLIEDVSIDAVAELKKAKNIKIVTRQGRDYDYIGWNNVDPELYSKYKGFNPNRFFGVANVRKALSYAINREEILKEHLKGFGQLSFGSVSPIFKNFFNDQIKPYGYNPPLAKEILASEGWMDRNQNGIIEKNNQEFSFKLYIAAGNPRRSFAATVVRNNLKAVGIDATIEMLEMGTFMTKLFNHELDAWMAGWTIPIPLDMQPFWHSDLNRSPFNLPCFANKEVDNILDKLLSERNFEKKKNLYKKIQQIIHEKEPVTFLYWLDVNTAYNLRIENISINPLGALQHCWEWRIVNR